MILSQRGSSDSHQHYQCIDRALENGALRQARLENDYTVCCEQPLGPLSTLLDQENLEDIMIASLNLKVKGRKKTSTVFEHPFF